LTRPEADRDVRKRFTSDFFGFTADGRSGERVAETLLKLAGYNGAVVGV
jgi:hypothetical protein